MSTIRANPTAPIAMPTLAPVLRPLKSLEAIFPAVFELLAGNDEGAEVGAGAGSTVRSNDIVGDGRVPVEGDPEERVPSAVGIGGQAVIKSCEVAGSLAQIMSNSYVLKIVNIDGAVTVAEEL